MTAATTRSLVELFVVDRLRFENLAHSGLWDLAGSILGQERQYEMVFGILGARARPGKERRWRWRRRLPKVHV